MSGTSGAAYADGVRGAVREGLRRLVRRAGPPPAADASAAGRACWRNALLDEVGSDARALVELLLRVEAHGVAAAVPAGPLAPAAWAPVRARLAFGYAAETFLDPDMARWAVDAWAYALGAVDAAGLYVAPPAAPLPPVTYPAPRAVAPTYATPSYGTAALAAAALAAPARRGLVPPLGAAAPRVPGRVRRAIARANAPPAANPFPKHFDQIAGYTFMGMVATAAGAIWIGIADRREAGGLEVRAGAAEVGVTERALAGVGAPAPAIAPLGRGVVVPRAGAADAGEVAGAASRAGAPEGASALDSVRLRDGTVRTGVVERLSPEGIVLRDPWSNRAAPLAFDDVVELRTRRGEVLPVGPAPADSAGAGRDGAADRGADSAGAPALHAAGIDVPAAGAGAGTLGHSARVAGLAGRYVVRRRVLAVSGSESCSAVAAAVGAAAPTVETVAHRPGEGEFALTSRPGLRGTVDDDGRFRTGAVAGSRGGVHYQFRMVGQFLPDGFRAETESETRAVLRWGEVQSCRVSVALDAARVP